MMPITIGPRTCPKSEKARKVPTAVPPEEPACSREYIMDAGTKNECPVPQSNPTTMNMGRVLEKDSMTMVIIPVQMNVRMIFSLL
jgi:hypothetical protein